MKMKRKKVKVTVYSDNNIQVYDEMKVEVDEEGEEWLSPDQVDRLEYLHNVIKVRSLYTSEDFVEVAEPLIASCSSELDLESKEASAKLAPRFYKSTPEVLAVA